MFEEDEYKNNPLVVLKEDEDAQAFRFGIRKARLIIEHIDQIKAFVEKHDTK